MAMRERKKGMLSYALIGSPPFGSHGRNVLGMLILLAQGGELGLLPFAVENIGIVFSKGSAGLTRQGMALDGFLKSAFHTDTHR